MSIRVLLREYPHRSIALVTPTHTLIFRHSPSTNDSLTNGSLNPIYPVYPRVSVDGVTVPKCMVEFADVSSVDLSDYRTLSPMPVHGTLGLITVSNDIFLCVITGTTRVAQVRPGETVEKILGVEFHCLNNAEYDNTFTDNLDPYNVEDSYGQNLSRRDPIVEHPCIELQKLLGNGSFYYSTNFDLTNRLQDRSTDATTNDVESFDDSFLWNSYMIGPLGKFRSRLALHEREALDKSGILTSAIRGFVLTITIPPASDPLRTSKSGLPSSLTLISRLSCRRAGTRFNSRGIDDDGNVANFVESETVYWSPSANVQYSSEQAGEKPASVCFSYAQIRGSVPIFFEQAPGLIPGQQKISVTRSPEGTQPAFDKHFEELERNYGAVHVVNLLSETKPGEAEITRSYQYGIRHSSLNKTEEKNYKDHQLLRVTEYDFHAETKGPQGYEAASMIRRIIENSADGFAYYLSEDIEDTEDSPAIQTRRTVVVLQQEGVFRTNCLDCLDRTNLIQTIISQMAIESFLVHRGARGTSDFWMRHSTMWADNGDALSKIYAGTGALKSSFTRHGKMSIAGAIADARKSATRLYINNFADKGRQNTIDVLLGRLVGQVPVHLFDPINDYVTAELNKRSSEFQSSEMINIWAGSFNLNGRTNGIEEDLSGWLCPELEKSQQQPEIVVVGFQEIVELSPQQIMNSDPTRKQAWEKAVRKTLNRHARAAGSDHYVLLRSGQLVGAALCVFVRASVLPNIKNVEGSVKKTGMSGMAGNKGAVSIRMDYADTQICFVTAHLAAGFSNYEERNRDYHTIHHGLRFQRNRGIDDHDTVIWMGDFNYRIGLGPERVKQLIKMGDLETLYENDQLNLQMVAGLTFQYYSESRITFMPTYKFDVGEDTYDTSEKARIPAWTDRILRKGSNLRQINYNAAPLRFSDHRPVYATFQCTVSIIDESVRDSLSRSIYDRRREEIGGATASSKMDGTDDEDLIGFESIEPGLPPASSDQRKWWLDGGKLAKSHVQPPSNLKDAVLNPKRPSNPWTLSDEPDWVNVPRPGMSSRNNSQQMPPQTPMTRNGTVPRKLPPPFDPSALPSSQHRLGNPTTNNSSTPSLPTKTVLPPPQILASNSMTPGPATTTKSVLPPPQLTRRASTETTRSSYKKAPPLPRKPVHLASTSVSPTLSTTSLASRSKESPAPVSGEYRDFSPPVRRATSGLDKSNLGPPPPPQSRRPGRTADDEGPKPELPKRPADLLGDSDDMGGWETLKPSR
ncbi:phosphoinositide phosphatase [Sclerotinia borealis F-4128]|uniref:phosphoinositide 5-phosphatase n=1 Tax=Sclerotinia borealis (strain F-4128) TaxID=1432307 RepID=W9CX94_SCLBF|nr:phosphoinositide phosphatase [Sclerotinia borealis F-4128]